MVIFIISGFCILKDDLNLANRRSIVQDCALNQLQYHSGNQSNQIMRNVLKEKLQGLISKLKFRSELYEKKR